MKTKVKSILIIIGVTLQCAGILCVIWAFDPAKTFPVHFERSFPIAMEVNFLLSLLTFSSGTAFVMYSLETCFMQTGRKTLFPLFAFLGPVGVLLFFKSIKKSSRQKYESTKISSKETIFKGKCQMTGLIFTFLISIAFIWASNQWIKRDSPLSVTSPERMRSNEILAFKRLEQIYDAQSQYILKDWDSDGEKNYAEFLVHLWKSIDGNANPVSVDLIPKELGYAMRRSYALDGYFFVDIHYRGEDNDATEQNEIDHKKEFIIAAFPASVGKTGLLSFIVNSNGQIFVKKIDSIKNDSDVGLFVSPQDLIKDGWKLIQNKNEIQIIQKQGSLK